MPMDKYKEAEQELKAQEKAYFDRYNSQIPGRAAQTRGLWDQVSQFPGNVIQDEALNSAYHRYWDEANAQKIGTPQAPEKYMNQMDQMIQQADQGNTSPWINFKKRVAPSEL
jgi:hypothetical protein